MKTYRKFHHIHAVCCSSADIQLTIIMTNGLVCHNCVFFLMMFKYRLCLIFNFSFLAQLRIVKLSDLSICQQDVMQKDLDTASFVCRSIWYCKFCTCLWHPGDIICGSSHVHIYKQVIRRLCLYSDLFAMCSGERVPLISLTYNDISGAFFLHIYNHSLEQ